MRHKNSWEEIPPVPFIAVLPLTVHAEIFNGQQDPQLCCSQSSLCATIAIRVVRGKSKMPLSRASSLPFQWLHVGTCKRLDCVECALRKSFSIPKEHAAHVEEIINVLHMLHGCTLARWSVA